MDTIRNWEKRYSFLKPHIGQNGEKMYSDADVDLLRRITTLLKTGGRISEIADRLLHGDELSSFEAESTRISNEVKLMIEEYYQYLLAADLGKIDQLESLIEITVVFKNRIEFIYYPLLERVRQDCAKEVITVAQEHFATGHMLNKLKGFLSASIYNHNSKHCAIICGTPSNSIFEGGSLVLACSMKLKGHNIFYLGSNLPVQDLRDFAEKVQPAVVAVSIYDPKELEEIYQVFNDASYPVCVGGLGVRLADPPQTKVNNIHLITQTGTIASEMLESISTEYLHHYRKK